MNQIKRKIIEACGLYVVLNGECAGSYAMVSGKFISLHEDTLTLKQTMMIFWVRGIKPLLFRPIATIKRWLKPDDAITPEDLAALTPQEREALK